MIELSIIRDLVAIFGVIAGFSYYVLTVRTNQKNQEISLKSQQLNVETRQAQMFMQIFQRFQEPDFIEQYNTLMGLKWKDAEFLSRILCRYRETRFLQL